MKLSLGQAMLLSIAAVPVVAWGLYKLAYPTYGWREKMTLSLETPDGRMSASAVRQITIVLSPKLLPEIRGMDSDVKGEAVAADLGDGKYLFALLGAPNGWAPVVYQSLYPDSRGSDAIAVWESALRGKGALPLPPKSYPTLVTFDDINDPASVKQVDPDDLDAAFGCPASGTGAASANRASGAADGSGAATPSARASGDGTAQAAANSTAGGDGTAPAATASAQTAKPCYALTSITLEITDEKVTTGKVESVLGWLKETGRRPGGLTPLPRGSNIGDYPDPEVQFLGPAAFSTEWNK